MDYKEVKITFTPFNVIYSDLLSALLGEIGYESFITDNNCLYAYIPNKSYAEDKTKDIINSFPIFNVKISFETKEIKERNWNEEWERNEYEPIIINDRCIIHASYHKNIPHVEYDITINPRMAFGSGTHETTRILTEILLNKDLSGMSAIDMGCGTGILGIAMSLKGAKRIIAIDIDLLSVENAIENIKLNNINNIEVIHGDASVMRTYEHTIDLIVANIHKNIILDDMHCYAKSLKPNGTLIVSGFYSDDIPNITKRALETRLTLNNIYTKNDWSVLEFTKTYNENSEIASI